MGKEAVASCTEPDGARLVERVHVLETIDGILSDEVPVVFVEGESGCGATILLKQFEQYKSGQCFSLFIRPASRFSYSLDYLRLLLAEQFASYLSKSLPNEEVVNEADYASLLMAVRKRKGRNPIYFIVDGLQQVPDAERAPIDEIFRSLLAVGVAGFRFIITGAQDRFASYITPAKSKAYTVQRLSRPEALQLLEGMSVSTALKDDLITLCKGLPGRLVSVKSLVASDDDARKLLSAGLSTYPDFIALEMRSLERLPEDLKLIVALVVYSKYSLSSSQLKSLANADDSSLATVSQACPYIRLSDESPFSEFTSESYRRYAEKLVDGLRARALSLQIDHLASNPSSREAVQFLPAYYQSLNQQQAILDMLDNEHYSQLLEATGSYASLKMRAAMGARSAADLKQAVSIFQFALQRSIFTSMESSPGSKSQVGALVALDRAADALSLATQAPTVELRLKMMSEYARYLTERELPVEDEVRSAIRDSILEVSGSLSEDAVEELAENIVHFDIDLALELLDKAEASDSFEKDDAVLKLTIAASGRPGTRTKLAERSSRQVTSARHRALIAFVANFDGGPSVANIEEICTNLSPAKRIYFLRCILAGPRIDNGALQLVSFALDQVVASTGYLPKVRDLADIATPLSYAAGPPTEVEALVARLEAQLGLAERSSGSVPLIDLRMKLAMAEASFDIRRARERLIDAYIDISQIALPDAKAECLALVLRALKVIDRNGDIDREEGLSLVLSEDLLRTLEDLLTKTASHFEVVRSALGVIVGYDPDGAMRLAGSLNTFAARDQAYETIAKGLVSAACSDQSISLIEAALDRVSERWRMQSAFVSVVESAMHGAYRMDWAPVLVKHVLAMPCSAKAAEAVVMLIEVYVKSAADIPVGLINQLEAAEASVSSGVWRCELLYRAAALLAKQSRAWGEKFYQKAEEARAQYKFISNGGVNTLQMCLSLLLRAARPLIAYDIFERSYLSRFSMLCDAIPDPCGRIAYLADLACKAACAGKSELARDILNSYCLPLLESDLSTDDSLYANSLVFAPAFMTRGAVALKYLSGMDTIARDQTLMSTCVTLITGVTEADAQPASMTNVELTYESAENVLILLEQIETDVVIAVLTRMLVDAALSKASRNKIASHQRAAIKAEIIRIAKSKLPQKGSVAHSGYLIEVEAYASQLAETQTDAWQRLSSEAARIPNLADRILVKLEIARVMPSRLNALAKLMLQECRSEISDIPSAYDRVSRMETLVEAARSVDVLVSKAAIRESLELSFEIDDPVVADRSRRKLLDLAEQFDPKGLDELVDSVDDDPARAAAKSSMREQVRVQKVRRKLADTKSSLVGSEYASDVLADAAHRNLVSLVSGRAEPLLPESMTRYVSACGGWDLPRAFPVLSWYLETIARRVRRQEDAAAKCAPPWEVLLLSSELAVKFIAGASNRAAAPLFDPPVDNRGVLVERDESGKAGRDFIREWLRSCSSETVDRIVISDPYFRPGDVDLLRLISAEFPGTSIAVVTSRSELSKLADGAFEAAWHESMDQDPPDVEIIGISDYESSKVPIHDRWILIGSQGLRMGSSFGGLGSRWCEVSVIDGAMLADVQDLILAYASKLREVAGRKVSYLAVCL